MFKITIAAAAAALVTVTPLAAQRTSAYATTPPAFTVATVQQHLDSARRSMFAGAFDVARREYVIAVALDRAAGRLPVESSFGLANTLYSMSANREAAMVLDKLAEEAGQAGDAETEARALVDAVWLNVDCGQREQARSGAARLRVLAKDNAVSAETRKAIKARVG